VLLPLVRDGQFGRCRRLCDFDRDGQTIADAGHRLDDPALPLLIAQRAAEFPDGGGHGRLDHRDPRPAGLQQFVLGDDFTGAEQQFMKHHQRLLAKWDPLAIDLQRPASLVKHRGRERPAPPLSAADAPRSRNCVHPPRFPHVSRS